MQNLTELQDIDKSATISDFNNPLPITDRTSKHKISKDIEELDNTINQFDLVVIDYSTQQSKHIHFF